MPLGTDCFGFESKERALGRRRQLFSSLSVSSSHVTDNMMLRSFSSVRQIVNLHLRNSATSPTVTKPLDPLYQGIKSVTAVDQVWNLIETNAKNMNEVHVITTLKMLKKIAVPPPPDSTDEHAERSKSDVKLINNVHFEKLCVHTLKLMRTMAPRNLCELLSHLDYLSVPPNTVVFRSLLVTIKNRMNEFSLSDIVMMDMVLSRLLKKSANEKQPDPLMTVIRMAFPLLVEIKIQFREVPYEDIDTVVRILRYSCNNRLKISDINHLVESINSRRDKLNPYQCFTVMLSLSKTHRRGETCFNTQLASDLTHHCMDVLAKSDYDRWEVDVRRIFERSLKLLVYHREYFDRATSLYRKLFLTLDFDTMQRVLRTLELNDHVDTELSNLYEERTKDVQFPEKENA